MTQSDIERELGALEGIIERGREDNTLVSRAQSILEYVSTNDIELRFRALLTLSEALLLIRDTKNVQPLLDEAQKLSAVTQQKELYSKLLASMGRMYSAVSDFAKAIEYLTQAAVLFEELGMTLELARVDLNIGTVYTTTGMYTEALEYLGRAHAVCEQLGMREQLARIAMQFGNVHFHLSEYAKALEHLERSLAIHEELGMKDATASVLGNMGRVYTYLCHYPEALEYCKRSLAIYEELGMKSSAAKVVGNMGNIYYHLADYTKALEFFGNALERHEELGMKESIALVTGNIGNVYIDLSDLPKALEYCGRAMSMFDELGMKAESAHYTGNVGMVHLGLHDYSTALKYINKALNDAREIGLRRAEATWLAGLGQVYLRMNELEVARRYLVESLDLRRNVIQSEEQIVINLLFLAEIEQLEGQPSESIALYKEVMEVAERLGDRDNVQSAHEGLSKLYVEMEQYKEAYMHYHKSVEIRQELNIEEARVKAEYIEYQRRQSSERAAALATTSLLHKVLPASVAERLINGEKVADYFPHISILFSDIVGFTPIAARMPAKKVLAFLNYIFGEFDRIIERHGCQKIKTIGDGYMAVCGAPETCDDHAERLARAALEIMAGIDLPDEIRSYLPKSSVFHIRLGLHTGSAFAGIVGDKGFVYDVYSDAVNVASRMESSGVPGRIHVSEEFALHVQNRDESFVFEERDEIEVKGKGRVRTYFLNS